MAAILNKFQTIDDTTLQDSLAIAIETSAGAGDAHKIVATNSSGLIDSSLIPSISAAYAISVETGDFNAAFSAAHLVDLATAAANVVATLPDATAGEGQITVVHVLTNSASHHVSFAATGGQTINNAAATSLAVLSNLPQTYMFLSDGANYETLSILVDVSSQVTGLLGQVHGGTGIDSSAVTDGQLFVGGTSSHDFALATLTAGSTKIGITNGTHTISIDVNQGNLSLGSIGGSLTLSTQVTGLLGQTHGGTGIDTSGATNGQVLIGKTSDGSLSLATLTAGSSKISITNGAASISLDVNQGNLTLSSIGGAITVGQDYDISSPQAGETIATGALVNLYNASGTLKARNADNTDTTKGADGWAVAGASSGSNITFKRGGGPNANFSSLTVAGDYYLGTSGGVINATTAAALGSGTLLQRVGKAVSGTSVSLLLEPAKIID